MVQIVQIVQMVDGKQELGRKEGEGECTMLYPTKPTTLCNVHRRLADSKEEEEWMETSSCRSVPDTINSLAPGSLLLSSSPLLVMKTFVIEYGYT